MPNELSLVHTFRRPDERGDGKAPLLLALHGIGSNERDLIGLQPHLDPRFFMVSAQAPYDYAFPGGYSWFGLEITPQGTKIDFDQLEESRQKIVRFIDECIEVYDIDPSKTFLLGFSQGSIMSYSVLATVPEKLSGIVAMSGRYLPPLFGKPGVAEKIKGFPIFVLHGLHDEVLPVENGREAYAKLRELQADVEYKEYPMGHEVSAESIGDVRKWLTKRLDT